MKNKVLFLTLILALAFCSGCVHRSPEQIRQREELAAAKAEAHKEAAKTKYLEMLAKIREANETIKSNNEKLADGEKFPLYKMKKEPMTAEAFGQLSRQDQKIELNRVKVEMKTAQSAARQSSARVSALGAKTAQ